VNDPNHEPVLEAADLLIMAGELSGEEALEVLLPTRE
jgi:hypothetical protein